MGRSLCAQLASFYDDFTRKNLVMHVDVPQRLPLVLADEDAAQRIFVNLLQNVLRYAESEVWVAVRAGTTITTVFTNDTSLVSQEDVPHVFDRFYTGDQTRSGHNTGIGLAIVKRLAEQMGCEVSASLAGNRFSISVSWKTI